MHKSFAEPKSLFLKVEKLAHPALTYIVSFTAVTRYILRSNIYT